MFLATPASGITSLKQLVTQARANPGELAYASAGIGGTQHLSAEMFKAAADIDIRHIPYKGSGPAQADFLGHQVPLMVDSVTAGLPHVQSKKAVARGGAAAPRRAARRRRLPPVLTRARRPPRCRVGSRPRGQCPRDPGGSHAGAGRPDRAGRAGPADDRAAGRFRSLSRSLIRSGSPTDTPPLPTAQERHVPYR
ncbi:hypothetical protein G6F22_013922 [Rhizopus arrhizus]|nr:hypothetical protein G6F22_013922 [Rhizopus arrhizus]